MGKPLYPANRQQYVAIQLDHPSTTSDTTWPAYKVPAGKTLVVDGVDYVNPTGLAEDTTNVFAVSALQGATVVAVAKSTDSDLQVPDAGFAAGTVYSLTLSTTPADLIIEAGETLSFLLDEDGSATLPPGRFVAHCRLI